MAKKVKRELTPSEELKKYNIISRVCFIGEFASIFAPFIAIGIINYDKYFVQYNGTKMSIAASLACVLMGLATWLVAKKKFTNTYVSIIVGWAMVTLIFFLLGEIINDIAYIMLFGLIGIGGAYGLDITSNSFKAKADELKTGIKAARQEEIKTAALKENAEKKIKVKIKRGK